MEFDVTNLDLKELIQTLFAHSSAAGLGQVEYNVRKIKGDNVDGLSDEECEEILSSCLPLKFGTTLVLDYHKGKPIKLILFKNKNGRVIVSSESYDERNGKYRFFEALLNIFHINEILITKKGYRKYVLDYLPAHLIRSAEQEHLYKNILRNTIRTQGSTGKSWVIDEQKVTYTPPYLKF